eukprot:4633507-Pyramimonas_sp.AAC.1
MVDDHASRTGESRRARFRLGLNDPIGPSREYTHAYSIRLVRRKNIPTLAASDWSTDHRTANAKMGPIRGDTNILATIIAPQ